MQKTKTKKHRKGGKRGRGTRNGGGAGTAMARIPSNRPFPPRVRHMFYYDTFFTLNNAAVVAASNTYNCSTPAAISGAVLVPGFSEMFGALGVPLYGINGGIYSAYRVRGTSVSVECDNLDTAVSYRIVAGFTNEALATNGAVTAGNQARFASNPDFRSFTLGVSAGASKGRTTVSSTIMKLFGAINFNNEDTFSYYALTTTTTQVPLTPMYFVLMALGSGVMTNGVATRLRFAFDVDGYARNNLNS